MVLLPWKGIEPGIVSSYKQVTRVKQNKMISAKKLIKIGKEMAEAGCYREKKDHTATPLLRELMQEVAAYHQQLRKATL
ncbi:hypothetical protein OIU74_015717 [Salix koriyanagi]|uniref:Uncharacterized protein n=1 Tax=Salix koriyanagi TaxID=2511006 RepID=A0A9Q0SVJ7_9ROSI|nr:hypothetical protein OIU74_015717 [Salix koriyanagi]